jgi:hypothetical protein
VVDVAPMPSRARCSGELNVSDGSLGATGVMASMESSNPGASTDLDRPGSTRNAPIVSTLVLDR